MRKRPARAQAAIDAHAAAEAAHHDEVRDAAPATLATARTGLTTARASLAAGRYDDAQAEATSAAPSLAEAGALVPPVDGVAEALADAESIRSDASQLSTIAAALAEASAAATEEPGDGVLAWSQRLETLAATLRAAPPVAAARFGDELTTSADALDRRRARFRRQIARAESDEAERLARVAICGDTAPNTGGWDGELIGSERFIAQSAHDPDSVDVENCTRPVLTADDCWVSTCDVRARNAFGAMVLQHYAFSVGRAGILSAHAVR